MGSLLLVLLLAPVCLAVTVVNLKTEYLESPLGIDRLFWLVKWS